MFVSSRRSGERGSSVGPVGHMTRSWRFGRRSLVVGVGDGEGEDGSEDGGRWGKAAVQRRQGLDE